MTGISWYEAAAYARFRGKSLPTVYHWIKAALPQNAVAGLPAWIVPASNFSNAGPAAVGAYQGVGPYGTYDMYGNASEWIWNRDAAGNAWTFGGSWQDAAYNFFGALPLPPHERSRLVGFRLMQEAGTGGSAALLEPIRLDRPVWEERQPVSDEVYAAYARQYVYEPGELNASAPAVVEEADDWVKERVTIDTGYGERMDIFLFVPRRSTPPRQAFVYFPAFDAFALKLSSAALPPGHPTAAPLDFIVKSGRVLVQPIYQGSYERFRAPLAFTDESAMQRRWVDFRWDIGRTVDYLQTRDDMDSQRIGYVGVSFGATFPWHLLALETRFRAALMIAGGLLPGLPLSLDAVHYAPRVRIPVLMVNGRFDYVNTLDSQSVLFDLIGTPAADKRHVLVDAGHVMPRSEVLRESLGWLDEYFGPIR